MTEVASAASAAGHATTEAAKKTATELLDMFLGILVPIGLFFAGVALAIQIGGYVTVGNFIWNNIGGGAKNLSNTLTGPQTGAIVGALFAAIWGVPAIALLRFGNSANKWVKYICRSVGAFFAGIAAFSVYYIAYSLGGGSSSLLGSGGFLDSFLGGLQTVTQRATGG